MSDLGIGIIGSGYMARTFAECLAKYTRGGRLRAIAGGTRAPATAAEFGYPGAPDGGRAAFPKARAVTIGECASHAPVLAFSAVALTSLGLLPTHSRARAKMG